jgi:transposase
VIRLFKFYDDFYLATHVFFPKNNHIFELHRSEQVADRWHLLKNLTGALKGIMDKQNQANRETAVEIAEKKRVEQMSQLSEPVGINPAETGPGSDKPAAVEKSLSQYEMMFEEVKKLQQKGLPKREINRRTGLSRKTITRYMQYDQYPQRAFSKGQMPKAAMFDDYLNKRWQEEVYNYHQLWKEIKEQGYDGSYVSLYNYMVKYYQKDEKAGDKAPPLQLKIYSARRLSYLLGKQVDGLEEKEAAYLKHLFKHCPEAELANNLALRFKKMITERKVDLLDKWIEDALESGAGVLKNFAQGLLQDYNAVKNACSLEWSNGQVEGQVNRLKNIKRQMYGRASFKLLKKMVLADTG